MGNSRTPLPSVQRMGIAIVLLYLLVNITHGAAHTNLHIEMNSWQSVYILLVILVLPLVAAVLLWRRLRLGFPLLLGSMLGALVFGGYYHFIAAGADNVASLPPHSWALPFQVTAVLLAVTEAAGVVIGVVRLRGGD